MSKVHIEKIKVKDLHSYASDIISKAGAGDVVPISLQRALAHSQNPAASLSDVGLLIALLDGRCVGFQGILPGWVRIREKLEKIYWISGLYITPEHRRSGIFTEILKVQMGLDYDFFYAGLSGEIVSVLRGIRMQELPRTQFLHLNLDRMNDVISLPVRAVRKAFHTVRVKVPSFDKAIEATQRTVAASRKHVYEVLLKQNEKLLEGFECEEVGQVMDSWFSKRKELLRFERDPSTINWMLTTPWLGDDDGKYYFGKAPGDWGKHLAIHVIDKKDRSHRGVVILYFSSRSGQVTLKVLDYEFENVRDKRIIIPVALYYGKNMNACAIEFSESIIADEKPGFLTSLLLQQINVVCFCALKKNSVLKSSVLQIQRDLGDGDTAFV